jgi:hypothetical protein
MDGKVGFWTLIASPSVRLECMHEGGTHEPAFPVQAGAHGKLHKAVTAGYLNHGVLFALQKHGRIVRDNAQKNAIISHLTAVHIRAQGRASQFGALAGSSGALIRPRRQADRERSAAQLNMLVQATVPATAPA